MNTRTLPGQGSLFQEHRAAVTPDEWQKIRVKAKRIIAMMLDLGGDWTLAEITRRCGGSETGNSAAMRAARAAGMVLHTSKRPDGVWLYRLEPGSADLNAYFGSKSKA